MSERRRLVAANWKMNGSLAANRHWLQKFAQVTEGARVDAAEVVVCPPFTYLSQLGTGLALVNAELGAQDLSVSACGAYTGDIAGEMLKDLGCSWVIVGHSERRQGHAETDALVANKAERALALGLKPIVCVGETLAERDAGNTEKVVTSQLETVLQKIGAQGLARGALAYEPIWAIGTGRSASAEQAQQVHSLLRAQVNAADSSAADALRIVYGGSVKAGNAAELFAQADIDGGLIGGASLIAEDFWAICSAR